MNNMIIFASINGLNPLDTGRYIIDLPHIPIASTSFTRYFYYLHFGCCGRKRLEKSAKRTIKYKIADQSDLSCNPKETM
jgi:hypothetical protein